MKIKKEQLTIGFIIAGLMNIVGVLVFSRLFNNTAIPKFDPQAMSNFGLLMIIVWGFAYITVSKTFYQLKWLIALFTIEKLIYATHWTNWILNNKITDVLEHDTMAGIFYVLYGVNDWICFLFFFIVLIKIRREKM